MYIYNKLRTDCIVLHVSPKLMIVRIQLCDAEQRASLQVGHVPYRAYRPDTHKLRVPEPLSALHKSIT